MKTKMIKKKKLMLKTNVFANFLYRCVSVFFCAFFNWIFNNKKLIFIPSVFHSYLNKIHKTILYWPSRSSWNSQKHWSPPRKPIRFIFKLSVQNHVSINYLQSILTHHLLHSFGHSYFKLHIFSWLCSECSSCKSRKSLWLILEYMIVSHSWFYSFYSHQIDSLIYWLICL